MDQKMQSVVTSLSDDASELASNGITISGGTGQFQITKLPTSGVWTLQPSDDVKNVIIESTSNDTMVVKYRALDENGEEHWLSKNTLFGKHFVEREAGDYAMQDIECRTSGFALSMIEKATIKPASLKNKKAERKSFDIYLFKQEVKIKFSSKPKVYLAENFPGQSTAWDKENKVMHMTRETPDYPILTLSL